MRGDFRCVDDHARRQAEPGPSDAAEDSEVDWGEVVPRLQAFYGGDPEAWFNLPVWALTAYLKMLSRLSAERQLLAIEAASVPHMKPDAVGRVTGRYRRIVAPKERPRSLLDTFREAGFPVVYEPAKKKQEVSRGR